MRIVVSSDGKAIESNVDNRFGRCKYFILIETKDKEIIRQEAFENTGAGQAHGAGIRAAQQVADLKADMVISGNIGPKASEVFNQLGIKVYPANGTVEEAVKDFLEGKLYVNETSGTAESPSIQKQSSVKGNNERIFFPLLDNNGKDSKIAEHFGHAPFLGLYDTATKELTIKDNRLDHADPHKSPVDQIVEAVNPTTVFGQRMGMRAIQLFTEKGISLKTGNYETVGEVIRNLDKLENLEESCGH